LAFSQWHDPSRPAHRRGRSERPAATGGLAAGSAGGVPSPVFRGLAPVELRVSDNSWLLMRGSRPFSQGLPTPPARRRRLAVPTVTGGGGEGRPVSDAISSRSGDINAAEFSDTLGGQYHYHDVRVLRDWLLSGLWWSESVLSGRPIPPRAPGTPARSPPRARDPEKGAKSIVPARIRGTDRRAIRMIYKGGRRCSCRTRPPGRHTARDPA
jgi:hypothetical protein